MGALYESYFLLLTSDIIFSLINKGSITAGCLPFCELLRMVFMIAERTSSIFLLTSSIYRLYIIVTLLVRQVHL